MTLHPKLAQHIALTPLQSLTPYGRNARRHAKSQIKQIVASIKTYGFTNPILIDQTGQILAGHGRFHGPTL